MNATARRATVIALASAGLFALTLSAATSAATTHVAHAVPNELIVGFNRGASTAERARALHEVSAHLRRNFDAIGAALVSIPAGTGQQAANRLRHDPHVRYVEPNGIIRADDVSPLPNDPAFGQLWGLDNTGQVVNFAAGTPGDDIGAARAWGVTTGSRNVVVAVIDTGIDYNHPDLAANIWTNPGESCAGCRNNGTDDDHNGYVDDWHGWNFVSGNNDPFDDNGHGTHVAGTIGAVGNNGIGVTGVDWTVSLMPLKVIGADGTGTIADAVSAILYASANGARIMNASWGTNEFSQALLDAIRVADSAGSLFVAAAGNGSSNSDTSPNYPSGFDVPNVISVAATDNQDQRAWFTNYGSRSVDLGAPGVGIYSTWPGASYQTLDGTSMATPHVSGAAALVEAAFPNATAAGTKALLLRTVDPIASLAGRATTGGRLDAGNAVQCTVDPELWVDKPQGAVDVYAGDTIQLSVLAAACGNPAGVGVSASAGGSPIALSARGDGLYTGTYTVGAVGSFSIVVTATAAGAGDSKTISGTVSPSYSIAPGGPPVTVTISVPGQNARLTFTGTAGQRISLGLSAGTMSQEKVTILNPDGSTLTSTTVGNNGFIDVKTLAATGSYTILIDPSSANTGSLTLTLNDVPPDPSAAIAPGGAPVTVTISVPGQNARLTFTGTAGQRIRLGLSAGTMSQEKVTILNPDGSTLTSTTVGNNGFIDVKTLAASGGYAILIDPSSANTGSLTLTLNDVPPDPTATIAPGGAPVTVTTSVPGQNARLSFTGTANQRISLGLSAGTMSQEKVTILNPDGSTLTSTTVGNNGFIDVKTLAASGGYAILIDPSSAYTGSLTLTLYDVPADPSATVNPGGPPVTVTTGVPGQNARLTFSGNNGQRISLGLSAGTMSQEKVTILNPDGSTLTSTTVGNNGFIDVKTLAATGSYTILIDPSSANTGSLTLTLNDVPPDPSAAIAPGGAPVTVTTSVPGQNARLTFTGTAGQQVTLKLSGVTMSSVKVTILNPDGSTLGASKTFGTGGGTLTASLPTAGAYAIVIDPQASATGSATFTLS